MMGQLGLFYRPRPARQEEPRDRELEAELDDIDRTLDGHEDYERALRFVRHLLLVSGATVDHEQVAVLARCEPSVAYNANMTAVLAGWAHPACSTFAKVRTSR